MLKLLWCWVRHPYQWTNLLWNGKRQKWMHWCHDCGDWRVCGRALLEKKMAAIMNEPRP